jgi:hypothetical protein
VPADDGALTLLLRRFPLRVEAYRAQIAIRTEIGTAALCLGLVGAGGAQWTAVRTASSVGAAVLPGRGRRAAGPIRTAAAVRTARWLCLALAGYGRRRQVGIGGGSSDGQHESEGNEKENVGSHHCSPKSLKDRVRLVLFRIRYSEWDNNLESPDTPRYQARGHVGFPAQRGSLRARLRLGDDLSKAKGN